MSEITPDVVRNYKEFTPKFLCGLDANIYNIQFKRFRIRDMESDFVLFDVGDDSDVNNKEEIKKNEEEEKAKKEAEEKDALKKIHDKLDRGETLTKKEQKQFDANSKQSARAKRKQEIADYKHEKKAKKAIIKMQDPKVGKAMKKHHKETNKRMKKKHKTSKPGLFKRIF
jgi:hypothetical protein